MFDSSVLDAPSRTGSTLVGRQKAKPSRTVRVDVDVARMVEFIVEWRGDHGEKITTASYVTPMIRAQVEAEYRKLKEEQFQEVRHEREQWKKRT